MIGRLLPFANAVVLLSVCFVGAQRCNVQGECYGTVITSVQTTNITEALEICGLVTGCTWVTVYYDVPYSKLYSSCDSVNSDTCSNCLSSQSTC